MQLNLTEIETTFMPWLMDQVGLALEKKIVARMLVDGKRGYNIVIHVHGIYTPPHTQL